MRRLSDRDAGDPDIHRAGVEVPARGALREPEARDEIDAQDSKNGNKALDDRIRNLDQRAAGMLTEAAAKIEALSRRVDEAS